MNLFTDQPPNNRWHWLRHGQSTANTRHQIASDPATATRDFGLSSTGRQQVRDTLATQTVLDSSCQIITSDFLRASQTAALTHEILQCHQSVRVDKRLRERYFGDWEATSGDNYHKVWEMDAHDASHTEANVEAVTHVAARLTDLVQSMEQSVEQQTFLLVSHGDPLQILECLLTGRNLSEHRKLVPLETAELRSFDTIRVG
ncbi:MAG: histidine phosphatase family protein [Pseudomonadota bacterium]